MTALQKSLPPNEYRAAEAWLSTFYPFQVNWLLDWERFALLNKSRQVGASHTYAGAATLWSLFGETTTIISIGDREGKEVLDKAERHAKALFAMGASWARTYRTDKRLDFPETGGRIIVLPSTSGGRSFSGNVILDEFAYHQHPEKVWDGAGGTVLHGYKLRVLSTPNGVGNLWYELISDPDRHAGYRVHHVAIDEARADGLHIDDAECWKMARNDPRVYDQLFRGKFLDNELQYLPTSMIESCQVDPIVVEGAGNYFGGLDIGKHADLTVLYVLHKQGQKRRTAYVETIRRTDADGLQEMVARAFKAFNMVRLCVDSTGLGAFPAEQLQKKHGHYKVEPIQFLPSTKEDMATSLYVALNERYLELPKHDRSLPKPPVGMHVVEPGTAQAIKDDLISLKRIVTNAGNIRYDAPHTSKGHADRAWALALALHACAREQPRGFAA